MHNKEQITLPSGTYITALRGTYVQVWRFFGLYAIACCSIDGRARYSSCSLNNNKQTCDLAHQSYLHRPCLYPPCLRVGSRKRKGVNFDKNHYRTQSFSKYQLWDAVIMGRNHFKPNHYEIQHYGKQLFWKQPYLVNLLRSPIVTYNLYDM